MRETRARHVMSLSSLWLVLPCLLCLGWRLNASAQQSGTPAPQGTGALTTQQVVEKLAGRNLERAQALHAYEGTRTYRVDYRGFPSARSAEMVVEVRYQSPTTKEFTIQSTSGSTLIVDRVFKKLLDAEKEALNPEIQRRSALTNENYVFTLVGYDTGSSGAAYVLQVEPRKKDKFLYRGRIWVDAGDFAVVRLQAEPAKNPSFWTRNSEIEQVYTKVNGFWLPERNHSVSNIRLGGHAELTIEYSNYRITGAEPVAGSSMPEPNRSADISHALRLGAQQ